MKLENYIAQLLYRYPCVTIPEFGSFLTEIQSARLHGNTNTFYPPKKAISFNVLLQKNDGLLTHYIAQSQQIPYSDALESLQKEVYVWKKTLENNEILILKNIGEIKLNSENNLVFTAFENTNFLTSSFGLSPVVAPIIVRQTKEITTKIPQEKSVSQQTEKTPKIIPISRKNKKKSFVKYAIAGSFLLTLGIFTTDYYYGNYIEKQSFAVEESVQKEIENKIQQATFVIETPDIEPITLVVKEEKLKFHIVAGAFKEEKNAEKSLKNLIKEGYNARKLDKNKYGLYPVVCQSCKTREEATKNLKEFRHKNPEAWLLVKELGIANLR